MVVLLVALICGISFMKADRREEKAEKPTYTVTVYKSLDGLVTCTNDEMVDTEDTSKLLLKAHGDEEVTLNVLADEGKRYAGTEVMDDTATSISVSENAQSANEEEISFTMPKAMLQCPFITKHNLSLHPPRNQQRHQNQRNIIFLFPV